MNNIGNMLDILNGDGVREYEKITRPAWDEYKKIRAFVYAEYNFARDKYEKIQVPAWDEYEKITRPARAKYEKIKILTYFKIASQKKYRRDEWK